MPMNDAELVKDARRLLNQARSVFWAVEHNWYVTYEDGRHHFGEDFSRHTPDCPGCKVDRLEAEISIWRRAVEDVARKMQAQR